MKSDIVFTNESSENLTENVIELLRGAVLYTLEEEGVTVPCEVSVLLTSNDEIHRLNLEYREKDKATDVLSFPLYDSREDFEEDASSCSVADFFCLGDIVIAPDVVKEAASEIDDSFEKHLCRMCIHSVLHLLGYDHETSPEDEKMMLALQEDMLENYWEGETK